MKCSKNVIMGKGHRLGVAYPPQIRSGAKAKERPKCPKLHGDTLSELASVSAPIPKPAVVLFQTTAAPIFSVEERNRRILLMADRSHSQCATLLGISRDVVRHVRAKQQWTPPEVAASVVQSLRPAVVAPPPEPRALAPVLPAGPALPATYKYPREATSSCLWPIGTPGTKTFHFCGCAEVVPGKPYCLLHTEQAYIMVKPRMEG
jgi:hypothetical protein